MANPKRIQATEAESLKQHPLHSTDTEAACDEPCDDCAGKGWEIFNEDPDAGELGDVQRCDICLLLSEDEAWEAARLAGYVVASDGSVLQHPLQKESPETTEGSRQQPESSLEDVFGPVIHSYTRAQAIEDGVLVDATATAQEAGFKVPTALTTSVWTRYVEVPPGVVGQDEAGRLWDILFMACLEARRRRSGHELLFKLYVRNDNRRPRPVELKLMIGPGDQGEPVATLLLPDED